MPHPPLFSPSAELTYETIPFTDETFPIRILPDMTTRPVAEHPHGGRISWHEQMEILYVLEGTLTCEIDFRPYRCCAGDIVMINPCEAHAVSWADAPARYHCLMIDPRLCGSRDDMGIRKFIDPITDRRVQFCHILRDRARLRRILEEMIEEFRGEQPGYELAVRGNLLRFLALLYRGEVQGEGQIYRPDGQAAITPALRYIADHYEEPITLDALAAACCMNRSYFCRRFHALTGRTAIAYVNEYRLTKAKALLLTTTRSIAQIAADTGFDDSSYFTRKFKALYGVSPSALRESDKEN